MKSHNFGNFNGPLLKVIIFMIIYCINYNFSYLKKFYFIQN